MLCVPDHLLCCHARLRVMCPFSLYREKDLTMLTTDLQGISFLLQMVKAPVSCSGCFLQGAHCEVFSAPALVWGDVSAAEGFQSWRTPWLQDPAGTSLWRRALGCSPGCHLLLETWFLWVAAEGCPLPWEGIAGVPLGVQLLKGTLRSVPLETAIPLLLLPSISSSPAAAPHSLCPLCPPTLCPSSVAAAPFSLCPWVDRHIPRPPSPPTILWGMWAAQAA